MDIDTKHCDTRTAFRDKMRSSHMKDEFLFKLHKKMFPQCMYDLQQHKIKTYGDFFFF